ncbi:MAG: class I tRNA ligase family protein, partial [Candidatus Korarchaeota archaeon]|nr:class I tRNA ligase family protein [Candidatus Korarchaeota archaeon]
MSRVRQLTRNFDPKKYEPEILKFWDEARVYERLRDARKGSKRFHFLDGPPYPSSDMPHPGTVWNKIIKDSVIRFKRGEGYDVLDKPGWDTHGLPIEVMTEKALGFTSKKDIENYGIDKFVLKCKELATKNLKSMTGHFKEFAVSMDWDRPYRTFENEYIESAWWGVKKIWESGRLYEGERPVHWCPR